MHELSFDKNIVLQNAITAFHKQTNLGIHIIKQQFDQGYDAIVQIPGVGNLLTFGIVVKNNAGFSSVNSVRESNSSAYPVLLVSSYISRELAQRYRALATNFIDSAGNAYINLPGLYINISGQPRPPQSHAVRERKAVSTAGLRVIFALLTQRELIHGNYRAIAKAANVSLGSVGNVLADLKNRGFIYDNSQEEHKRRITDFRRLVEEWSTYYPAVLRPKLNVRRFSAKDPQWWQNAHLNQAKAVWGGEVAAARLVPNFKPAIITVYVSGNPDDVIVDNRLQLDVRGNVEILEMFWDKATESESVNNSGTANPILIYADLMATADPRDREIAKQIFGQYIENINY
jgi:hypothetical protein